VSSVIGPGPDGAGSAESLHYVYDRRDGRILASSHVAGDVTAAADRATALLREIASRSGVPAELLALLEVPPESVAATAGRLRVDHERRELVSDEPAPLRRIEP
jgi:hypothetical protein